MNIVQVATNQGIYVVSGVNQYLANNPYKGLPKLSNNHSESYQFNTKEEAIEMVGVIKFLVRNGILKIQINDIRVI